jgi:hypothetical protein
MEASRTAGTAVPAIPLHGIALELKYLQIIAKMANRQDSLQWFKFISSPHPTTETFVTYPHFLFTVCNHHNHHHLQTLG